MVLKTVIAWVGLLVIMFALATLREVWLRKRMGEPRAHQLGSLAASAAVFAYALWFVGRVGPSRTEALLIGAIWLGMTLVFEFGFFHYVMKKPWSQLRADYRIHEGRLWLLVLLSTLLAPLLVR